VSTDHQRRRPWERLALQLQGSVEVGLLRHGLMASSPDGPRDNERRLDPALG
jgi:hypothetical protein